MDLLMPLFQPMTDYIDSARFSLDTSRIWPKLPDIIGEIDLERARTIFRPFVLHQSIDTRTHRHPHTETRQHHHIVITPFFCFVVRTPGYPQCRPNLPNRDLFPLRKTLSSTLQMIVLFPPFKSFKFFL